MKKGRLPAVKQKVRAFYRFQKDALCFRRYKIFSEGGKPFNKYYFYECYASGGYLISTRLIGRAGDLLAWIDRKQEDIRLSYGEWGDGPACRGN